MDATNKETNIRRSIKKFFIDGLPTLPVLFDRSFTISEESDQWVSIIIEALRPRVVSVAVLLIYLNTSNDIEGDKISVLRDTVFEILEPGRIDLYNTFTNPWVKVGGMQLIIEGQSRLRYARDQSKTCWITTTLRWGAVW